MAKRYVARPMTEREQQEIEQVLLEQVDIQHWYAVEVIQGWVTEILITLN